MGAAYDRPMNKPRFLDFSPRQLLWASILVALITIGLKTWAWYITDSVGLLSDAMESLVNLASAMFGLTMVTVAALPPTKNTPMATTRPSIFRRASKAF
jgi:Co/Zn/Cd efflux system component